MENHFKTTKKRHMLTSITPKHPNKISDSEIPSALNRTPSISQNTGLKKEIVSNGAGSLLTE